MTKTKFLICLSITSFLAMGWVVLAADIQYPVAELGNCQDKAACKIYCDKPENTEACLNFAQKNGLMAKEEVEKAKKFMAIGDKKPGGCSTKDTCETYCDDISHIDECLAFAIENDVLPPEKLEEAKKAQAAIKRGVKPPACGNKNDCDEYCDSPEHMEECMTFAMEAGFMSEQEKADSQKMLAAVKRGIKPPPCKGKEACDEYCSAPENMETCMSFAMEAGFMTEQEKANSQKIIAAVKKGAIPPKCKGKECDIYCQQEEHFEECLSFSEAAGLMNPEEAAMSRKTGGKGPGGCKGKEECETFCNNPDNQETCFNFGKDNGMIPEKDLKRMEEGKQQFKQSLSQAPQAVLDCLNSQMGSDMLEKLKSGQFMPPKDIGDKMQICFEQGMGSPKPDGPGEGGMIPPSGQTGPGGCKTSEECQSFCASNPQECQNFQPPMPQQQSEQSRPTMSPDNSSMGISNEQPQVCESPEQCQQMQQQTKQMQEQIQNQVNQMAPPQPCQGEGCNYGPPPTNTSDGTQPYQQYQQPPQQYGAPQQYGPSTGPTEYQPQMYQQPPDEYQPQIYQEQPMYQQPPNELLPPPQPSGFLSPENFLGSIISLFGILSR